MDFKKVEFGNGFIRIQGPVKFRTKTTVVLPVACLQDTVRFADENGNIIYTLCYKEECKKILKMIQEKIDNNDCWAGIMHSEYPSPTECIRYAKVLSVELIEMGETYLLVSKLKFINNGLPKLKDWHCPDIKKALEHKHLEVFIRPNFTLTNNPKKPYKFEYFELDV